MIYTHEFWVGLLVGAYLTGFVGVFLINVMAGPVTLGLSMVRAVVWPYYVATGKPKGERF